MFAVKCYFSLCINYLLLHALFQPNSIILAISPANQDIATSDAIKLAKEVDPSGIYTSIWQKCVFHDFLVNSF